MCLILTILGGCGGGGSGKNRSITDPVDNIVGGVTADEPRAVLIARDIFAQGGNAADAMVALYFGLSVTMPHVAGLGGGGECIAHSEDRKMTDLIRFRPADLSGQNLALPGSARGMAGLWARHGKLNWAALVGPAENIAAFGTQASRALSRDLDATSAIIAADPSLSDLYLNSEGQVIKEGEPLRSPGLAGTLGQIRANGGVALNNGALAQKYANSLRTLGYQVESSDLRGVNVQFLKPFEIKFGDQTIYVPDGESASVIEAAINGTSKAAGMTSPVTGAATFDDEGNSVSCIFTLNEFFGIGHIAPETGITPAAANRQVLAAPVIVANSHNGHFYFAASGAGQSGLSQLAQVLKNTVGKDASLREAMIDLAKQPVDGKVNAIFCPGDASSDPDSCEAENDPRGNGLSNLVGK